ncbi:unnamed protein product [Oikopleura dioica]|uniref:Uncharacterized protein n=1 Tax=Oikopleura dioica TaxID=34765 RepID=E4YX58_OIKDI|nr:unnamed protein product [Oikopleura dioica]
MSDEMLVKKGSNLEKFGMGNERYQYGYEKRPIHFARIEAHQTRNSTGAFDCQIVVDAALFDNNDQSSSDLRSDKENVHHAREGHTQARSKYSAREREKGARDKIREHKRLPPTRALQHPYFDGQENFK